ncbi:hypothetical protein [Paenibacillus alvei]|uniref:hypothetical protein n=1 Tax=Paenibacillus alvei TaxID=44250 RepID=UPI0018CEB8A7|nr:hypothetical protein [Paenibacillus alvei]MCY9583019.1 hypothetical protein [Paenibacillus alvei]MCY9588262.1 hypothetical protein [Paenibacillus alvei]
MIIKRDIMKISVMLNKDGVLKMANRIVEDWGNKLIIYGYRRPLGSRTYLPFLPEAIVDEFIDAKVVLEHSSKEQKIYQIYYCIEWGGEFIFRIIVSYLEDSITILQMLLISRCVLIRLFAKVWHNGSYSEANG